MKRRIAPSLALIMLLSLTLSSSAAQSIQVTPLPPVTDTDGRGGICFSYYPGDPERPYLPLAKNAGSRWDRFDFIWPNIEKTDNGWHYDGYDALVQDMSDAGMNVVGILLWTPPWAATNAQQIQGLSHPVEPPTDWYAPSVMSPREEATNLLPYPPKGLYEDWDCWSTSDPDCDAVNYWGRYVHTVVSRYSDPDRFTKPVKHWEIWNEVDDGAWNYFWRGSKADYAQLLKVGYQATKAACPDCTVLYAGLLYWADQHYFEDVLDILNDDPDAAANNYYFDAMSVHLYSRSSTTYDTINHIRSRMEEYVPTRPLWLTETGVPVWGDEAVDEYREKYNYAATQEEAAAYVIQSYANAWASGVARYFFFRANDENMRDAGGHREYFGMMRNDQSFRPSYVAYQVATSYMVSPTISTSWTYSESGVRRVTLWGTPRGKVSVLWNLRPDQVTFAYDATLPTAKQVDQDGSTETIAAANGHYQITLPGATAHLETNEPDELPDYYIGGQPYLIIEEDTTPPSETTVDPLPPTTYSHTIPVSWKATDAEAGIWGYDVQVKQAGGEWASWLGLVDTRGAVEEGYYSDGEDEETYCFRARAWDNAGNRGAWSDGSDCTTLIREQTVEISVGSVFGDDDGDGTQSGGSAEPTLTSITFQFVDETGQDVVTPALGSSWSYSDTLTLGTYALRIYPLGWPSSSDWLPRSLAVPVHGGTERLSVHYENVGLPPLRSSRYLPLIGRGN